MTTTTRVTPPAAEQGGMRLQGAEHSTLAKPKGASAADPPSGESPALLSTPAAADARQCHVLVVDDDPLIRDLLTNFLEHYGYQVTTLADGGGLCAILQRQLPDLIVLDLKLPGEDGLVVLRKIRATADVPVIMLTNLGSEVDRIVGLELGADDYLPKPFNPRELLARIRAVLRRNGRWTRPEDERQLCHELLCFEGWTLNLTLRELRSPAGERVDLTAGEHVLLEAFLRAPQRVLTRDQLLEMTHSHDGDVYDRTIDVLVLRLRRKIEPNPKQPRFIRTERNAGYVFSARVQQG